MEEQLNSCMHSVSHHITALAEAIDKLDKKVDGLGQLLIELLEFEEDDE